MRCHLNFDKGDIMKIVAFTLGTQKRISFTKENSNGFIEAYQLNTRDMFRPEVRMAYEKEKIFY